MSRTVSIYGYYGNNSYITTLVNSSSKQLLVLSFLFIQNKIEREKRWISMRFQRAIQIFFVCFKGKKNFYPKRLGWKIRFSIFCFDSIFNVRIFTVLIYCGSSHAENTLFYEHKIEQKKVPTMFAFKNNFWLFHTK